ncbi:Pimeloyl-ACP methyl ester carboxylesterase [Blastococcus haudaquaticus]|uniref:Pimeloyl-ACP methyl ester carboxylesterase n=2 Tax=Blastococcus haudaquaticus TaxID=1938745 RepID=A0A286GE99_9ACTN|nr:Pimeloyl-ACP methyl ester carboxylesterase [Blastococcus haudaquaticus]
MQRETTEGYAAANGVQMYWRSVGEGGTPLVLVHGGFGLADNLDDLAGQLAGGRRVIAVELQGHGRTADVDRPFSSEAFGDDLAALIGELGLGQADLLGYSLGAQASLRAAIQHPDRVRRLVSVSGAFRRDGWFPEVLEAKAHVNSGLFEQFRHSPPYAAYAAVAPDVDAFPVLMDKTGALLARGYDWTEDVRALRVPTLLVFADADGIPPSHMAEFFALLGGGLRDAGWDGAQRPESRLAVLPGRTHYDVVQAPELPGMVADFLA